MSSRNVLRRGLKTSSSLAQSLPALKERSAAATPKQSVFSQIFGGSATKQPPMDEPMPNVIVPESPIYPKEGPKTLITTLSNGATIASENTPGATMAVGLYLESGSKYEQRYMSGASHMLERMAFKATMNRTNFRITKEAEVMSASLLAAASREQMSYTVDALKTHLPEVVELLCDSALNPKLANHAVANMAKDLKKEIEALPADDKSPSGVPDFWLVAMKNIEDLAEEIKERDEACLSALCDVQTGKLEGEDEDGDEMVGFYLRFYFKENAYFTNKCIEKRYHMEDDSEDAVLNYIVCDDIDWKPGKNLTVKVLRKKPKPGAKNQKQITKTEPCESFFTFFYPLEVPDEDDQGNMTEEEVEELQEQMENDYAIGSLIATALVPNAVDHFLGLHLEDDEDEDGEEEDEDAEYGESIDGDDEDDDDSDEDDSDEDDNGEKIKGLDPKAKEECKQQ